MFEVEKTYDNCVKLTINGVVNYLEFDDNFNINYVENDLGSYGYDDLEKANEKIDYAIRRAEDIVENLE